MIRLGILDFDTSHVVEFTRRLNHKGIAEDQWVDGAEVVIGCPGESKIMPERIPGYADEMKKLGVALVDKPEEMIGKVDGMLIESQEGGPHWERARPFLEAGLPCYIDKPFTCGVADARKIVDLANDMDEPPPGLFGPGCGPATTNFFTIPASSQTTTLFINYSLFHH